MTLSPARVTLPPPEGGEHVTERLRRLILVRHGETAGQSSIRYYGVTDVPLSDLGRRQVRVARDQIRSDVYDGVWASTLCRSWESARIVAPGRPVHLESDFREIDFGDWEGLTKEEIAERDPAGFARWESEGLEFAFPAERAATRSAPASLEGSTGCARRASSRPWSRRTRASSGRCSSS